MTTLPIPFDRSEIALIEPLRALRMIHYSGWLARRGIAPMTLLTAGMGLALMVELAIILDLAGPALLWPLLGLSFQGRIGRMRNLLGGLLVLTGMVWLLLLVVSGCGAWASGYGSGAGGIRSAFNQWVFPLLIGVVIPLIADVDRPHQGLIGVSQQPMQDLLESMQP